MKEFFYADRLIINMYYIHSVFKPQKRDFDSPTSVEIRFIGNDATTTLSGPNAEDFWEHYKKYSTHHFKR